MDFAKLRETFPNAAFTDLSGKMRMMRTVRSEEEIERIRFASKLTDQSIEALAEANPLDTPDILAPASVDSPDFGR